jgi:anaerobic magnesium-protoporphyrin IX monomethyl ester cyclase
MSNIVLINPFSWTRDGRASYLPYGILSLASYLRKRKVKVAVFDCNVRTDDPVEFVKLHNPDFVGLSVLTGPVIKEALKISREVSKLGIKTIWGGLHPTLFPDYVRQEKSVDYIVQGEGEEALYQLINNNEYGNIYAQGEFIDLNNEDMPAWDLVDMDKYIMNRIYADRVLTFNSSRGCVNKCSYCMNQAIVKNRWRALSAKNTYLQIMYLKERYDINGIQFYEDSFDVNKQRVKDFCKLMIGEDLKWSHFGNVNLFDRGNLLYEKDANCAEVSFGVESGSDRMLKFLNKRQTIQEIEDVFENCKRVRMRAIGLFMIGLPTEQIEDVEETLSLLKRLPAYQSICTIYRPYPGTPLYRFCADNNKFREPKTLEEQADFYAYGELTESTENMSYIPTKTLLKIQRSLTKRNMVNEVLLCLKTMNYKRILYYARRNMLSN